MPTYAYACTACEHRFEIVQSFSDDSLTKCPECEGRLRKLFNAVGVVFKGSGFYRTDSRNDARARHGKDSRGGSGSGKSSRGGSGNGSGSGSGNGSGSGSGSGNGSGSSSESGSSSSDSSSSTSSSGTPKSATKTAMKSEGSAA